MTAQWDANSVREAMTRFMKSRKLNINSWSRQAKISQNTLRNFLSKKSNSMTHETLTKLAHAVGASIVEITGSKDDEVKVHPFPSTISATGRLNAAERALLETVIVELDAVLEAQTHQISKAKRAKVIVHIFETAASRLYRTPPEAPERFDIGEYRNVIQLVLPDNGNNSHGSGRAA